MTMSKICPECDQPNSFHRTTCHSCGGRLPVIRNTDSSVGAQIDAEMEAIRGTNTATEWLVEHGIIGIDDTAAERAKSCRKWMMKIIRRGNGNLQMREANEIARRALDQTARNESASF